MTDIQNCILHIFKEVDGICARNGIPYYAIGGTCIGAVRHKGFIPWDDDLDIAIPIEEWDRFWACAKKELPSRYEIYDCSEIHHFRYIFSKVIDRETTFIEEADWEYPDAYKGIYMDIMPLAGIPSDSAARGKYYRKIYRLSVFNFVRRYPLREMQNVKRRVLWFLCRIASPLISYHFFSDRWLALLKKHPVRESAFTGFTWDEQVSDKLCFPCEFFGSGSKEEFENTRISCPSDSDGYLSREFGDYMTLPPEHERLTHHQYFVNTSIPYAEYRGAKVSSTGERL